MFGRGLPLELDGAEDDEEGEFVGLHRPFSMRALVGHPEPVPQPRAQPVRRVDPAKVDILVMNMGCSPEKARRRPAQRRFTCGRQSRR